eukprot:scaffold5478_cov63-Phaeocystis_antarctica.AAC.3
MSHCHVGHDAQLGDRVVLASNSSLAGHVRVGDDAQASRHSACACACDTPNPNPNPNPDLSLCIGLRPLVRPPAREHRCGCVPRRRLCSDRGPGAAPSKCRTASPWAIAPGCAPSTSSVSSGWVRPQPSGVRCCAPSATSSIYPARWRRPTRRSSCPNPQTLTLSP